METMGSLRRTNYCGEVSMSNVGQEMTVCRKTFLLKQKA